MFMITIILSLIGCILVIQIIKSKVARRRNSRRVEHELAEYLCKQAPGKK